MSNLAQEARSKVQQIWPGAAVHSRGPNWIRHQHPTDPDRFIIDSHIGPIHYGPSKDQEIDTAWQPTTGAWQYEMTSNDFQTFARDTFNAGDIFEFRKEGEWLRFDPQSINWIDENNSRQQIGIKQAVTAVVNDDVLEFPAGYGPGRHFQYQNQTARLQKLISIDAAADLPTPTVQGSEIWFEAEFTLSMSSGINFWIDGVEWSRANGVRVQTAGRIEIRDAATGTQVFWHLDHPRAFDSSGDNEIIGHLEVRRQGGPSSLFITVRIPKTWIDAAIFPIYIDPTIDPQVGASADDAVETSGSMDLTATNALINTSSRYLGARWVVNVSNGATIDVAYASYYSLSPNRPIDYDLMIEDVDDAAIFTTTASDISSRTAHATQPTWTGTAGANEWIDTSSLVTPIEAVIGRAGWSANNHLVITLTETSGGSAGVSFRTYDGSSTYAPKLHIEYSTGGATYPIPEALHSYRQRRL